MIHEELSKSKTLLLVDDEATNLHILRQMLQNDYRLLFAKDGRQALAIAEEQQPDLILLDILLPDLSGYDVCRELKHNPRTLKIPVIFVTAMFDSVNETQGFEVGGVDYIIKPLSPTVVRARVANQLSLVRAEELQTIQLQLMFKLAKAAEYRDNETGRHVIRISHYSRLLALAAGYSEQAADEVFYTAPMHDVGKIGIPDRILLKPGPLDAEEWAIMRKHPEIGANIIGEHESSLLKLASIIAQSHHEKWDGSGYPKQLKGEEIPQVARIVALADVFDALTTKRPYKEAWPVQEAVDYIQQQSGKHFDPELVGLFMTILPDILEVKTRWAEEA